MPSTISFSSRMWCSSCICPACRTSRAATGPRRCRVIGVVAGRPVHDLAVLAHGEVVGDRDRLVVRDEEAVLRARRRAPGAHARVGAGLQQIDRRVAAGVVRAGVLRHPLLMRAPAELGRLQAFRDEALDRPGVDEDVHAASRIVARCVSRSAMWMPLTPTRCISRAQSSRLLGSSDVEPRSPATFEQRLLDEPRDHAGIGAAAGDRRRAARRARGARRASSRAGRSWCARAGPLLLVEIEAGPRLDDGVDVERAELAAELHDVDARTCRPRG